MREIKFREWETYRKTMAVGIREDYDDSVGFRFLHEEAGQRILMQYTGLKDSHGNEIYEGDILEAIFELFDGELKTVRDAGVVVFKDCAFQIQTFEDHLEPLHEWSQLSEELKVIGDIYENPELLKEVPQ